MAWLSKTRMIDRVFGAHCGCHFNLVLLLFCLNFNTRSQFRARHCTVWLRGLVISGIGVCSLAHPVRFIYFSSRGGKEIAVHRPSFPIWLLPRTCVQSMVNVQVLISSQYTLLVKDPQCMHVTLLINHTQNHTPWCRPDLIRRLVPDWWLRVAHPNISYSISQPLHLHSGTMKSMDILIRIGCGL